MISIRQAATAIVMIMALCACASAPVNEKPHEIPILMSWSGTFPVAELDLIPRKLQHTRNGYIDNNWTFARIWKAYMPQQPLPEVDFKRNLVVFSRNLRFFNQTSIVHASEKDGVLEIVAIATMSAQPITDRVAMAMVVIPRHGIEALRVEKDKTLKID